MLKPYRRIKRNVDVGLDTEKLGIKRKYQEYAKTRNQVKSAIRKATSHEIFRLMELPGAK
jgi:hypothetical protein